MFKSYLKLATRNLMKHKVFSFINIFGLAMGFICCMLISLYIYHEYSYDKYHSKAERIFQLNSIMGVPGEAEKGATVPAAMAGMLRQEYPEIEKSARLLPLFRDDKTLLKYEPSNGPARAFYETSGFIADSSFFEIFDYDFIEGDPKTALENPSTIVVTEEIAKKRCGDQPALGKQILVSSSSNGDHYYSIAGVFRPNPRPSHIDARFFLSVEGGGLEEFITEATTLLNNNMFFTYLLLRKGSDPASLEEKFDSFIERNIGAELKARGAERNLFLTALEDIHLASDVQQNITPAGSVKYIRILASIAILTLLIACINFMNLSTSRSSKRSVEVGVRKVLGAEKKNLVYQFLGESLVLSLIAFIIGAFLVQLLLPLFEQMAGKQITLAIEQQFYLYLFFLGLAVITGILAGSYPAFFLSSFKPVRVLKGRFSNTFAAVSLRKGLVVVQFVISVVLIIASLVISDQMDYLRSKDLGFQKEHQLIVPLRSENAKSNYENLKSLLNSQSSVEAVGASFHYPGIDNPTDWLMYKEGNSMKNAKSVFINRVDESFLQTLEIAPLAGRIFSREFSADSANSMVLNKTAIEELGFSSAEEAVGKWIAFDWEGQQIRFGVVGVVKDFHFKDLHEEIEPYGFLLNNTSDQNYLIAQLGAGDIGESISAIQSAWESLIPDEPFESTFLDQDFQKNYEAEYRLAAMIRYFTILAILISCLGLFGLVTFSAEQRIKEIGLRKILGASMSNLIALLSLDFLKLVLLSVLIASPIAWYVMNQWLQTFAFRVEIGWQVFVFTTILAVLIAFITVSFQAIKSAMANPVKNLRME